MKILILTLWCLIPLGLVAYHYGPGQTGVALDQSAEQLRLAASHAAAGKWAAAIESYERALGTLPKDKTTESQAIRLAIAKARIESGQLPQARTDLEVLAREIAEDPAADPALRDDTLSTLASSRFYMTYLMKLEGLPEPEWLPEIEAARQERKLLLQRAEEKGDAKAAAEQADALESAIRLARTEPADLYAKPIPKQCNCKSGKCKKPSKKTGPKQDSRSAGSGPPADGEGY